MLLLIHKKGHWQGYFKAVELIWLKITKKKIQASKCFQVYELMLGFCSFGPGLFFNMMAFYHILIKQFSCSFDKVFKQVLESSAWLTFPQIYQEKDWCASLKRLKFLSGYIVYEVF